MVAKFPQLGTIQDRHHSGLCLGYLWKHKENRLNRKTLHVHIKLHEKTIGKAPNLSYSFEANIGKNLNCHRGPERLKDNVKREINDIIPDKKLRSVMVHTLHTFQALPRI